MEKIHMNIKINVTLLGLLLITPWTELVSKPPRTGTVNDTKKPTTPPESSVNTTAQAPVAPTSQTDTPEPATATPFGTVPTVVTASVVEQLPQKLTVAASTAPIAVSKSANSTLPVQSPVEMLAATFASQTDENPLNADNSLVRFILDRDSAQQASSVQPQLSTQPTSSVQPQLDEESNRTSYEELKKELIAKGINPDDWDLATDDEDPSSQKAPGDRSWLQKIQSMTKSILNNPKVREIALAANLIKPLQVLTANGQSSEEIGYNIAKINAEKATRGTSLATEVLEEQIEASQEKMVSKIVEALKNLDLIKDLGESTRTNIDNFYELQAHALTQNLEDDLLAHDKQIAKYAKLSRYAKPRKGTPPPEETELERHAKITALTATVVASTGRFTTPKSPTSQE